MLVLLLSLFLFPSVSPPLSTPPLPLLLPLSLSFFFSLTLSQQLPFAHSSLARAGTWCSPLHSILGLCLAWSWAGLVHDVTTLWVHLCNHPYVWKTLFLCSHSPCLALTGFLPPILGWSLNLGREKYDAPFENEHLDQLWICYSPLTANRSFSGED